MALELANPQSSGKKNISKNGTVMPTNTTRDEDDKIDHAHKSITQALIEFSEVINSLDIQITEWCKASGCMSPEELKRKLQRTHDNAPPYNEAELNAAIEKGTKAWAAVADSKAWVERVRGNKP